MVINLILDWPGWGSKPRWILAAAQVVLIGAFSLLGSVLVLNAERQQILQVNQMIMEQRAAIRHLRRQLDSLPSFAALQVRLAERKSEKPSFHADMPSLLVSAPLSKSGAVLLSWQPAAHQDNHQAWLLTLSADYQGLLLVLRKFIALPHVLRIERLTMTSVEGVLHIDMHLLKATAERRAEIE
ncbi:hypothetical protein V2I52_22905 [Brenneria sp. g21c3]|uniref:hypothetical protein n=1 Tax=Brenneria sp. g21c3 TaxID=3093893 RepID=UPI002ECB8C73|nr:hypothetical protein [Brenneria sp. g21c3]